MTSKKGAIDERGRIIHAITKKVKNVLEDELDSVPDQFRQVNLMISVLISVIGSMVAQLCVENEPGIKLEHALGHPNSQIILKNIAIELLNIKYSNADCISIEER
jgi:hypothetical protein